MPFVNVDPSTRLYYRLEGLPAKPVLVLSHSLGCDHGMWNPQMPSLLDHFQVLRYDTRGHGASDTSEGEYTVEKLARDVLAIADHLEIASFAFCGLSLGGMTGQWIAAHAPERLTHLVLANTSARFPDPSIMETRRRTVLEHGMKAVETAVLGRFFMPATLAAASNPDVESTRNTLLSTKPAGYAACCSAVRDLDHRSLLGRIHTPTLVIAGDHDQSTPWHGHGDMLANQIPGATAVRFATAHLSNIERPRSFAWALLQFLVPPVAEVRNAGEVKRRAVLGYAHVDRSQANLADLHADFQELITTYAWGSIWTRPGLDTRTRRLLVLATTAAMGRWEEFRLHVRTGLAHELELCDLKEVLMQSAVYAGVPCANTGFQIVAEELARENA